MKTAHCAILVLASTLLVAPLSRAQDEPAKPFDWKRLEGAWAEGPGDRFTCTADAARFRFVASPDRKHLAMKFDGGREWGAEVRRTTEHYVTLRFDAGHPQFAQGEWQLRLLGPASYQVVSTRDDNYATAFGVKCDGPPAAAPQAFDWKLLEGLWAESARRKFACGADQEHYRLVASPDRKRIVIRYDRPTRLMGGREVRELGLTVRRVEGPSLFVMYDKDDPFMSTGEWEFRFLSAGAHRMRFVGWDDPKLFAGTVGVKCGP